MGTTVYIVHGDPAIGVLLFNRVGGCLHESKVGAWYRRRGGQNLVCEFLGGSHGDRVKREGNRGGENRLDSLCVDIAVEDMSSAKGFEEIIMLGRSSRDNSRESSNTSQLNS